MSDGKPDNIDEHAALRAAETRLRFTFERAPVGICHTAPDGRWIDVNDSFCEILGRSRKELLNLRFQQITPPEHLEDNLQAMRRMADGEIDRYSADKPFLRKDGSLVWVRLVTTAVRDSAGVPVYFIAVVEDISERRAAERALRISEEHLAHAQRIAHIGWWEWDPATDAMTWSDERFRLLGYARGEVTPSPAALLARVHPQERERVETSLRGTAADGGRYDIDYRIVLPGGEERTLNEQAETDGPGQRLSGMTQDISARTATAQQLRRANDFLQALYDVSPDMIFLHTADGRVVDVNDNVLAGYGYSREEMLSLPFTTFVAEGSSLDEGLGYLEKARAGEPQDFEWRARRKSGEEFPVEVRLRRLAPSGESASYVVATVRDISEQKWRERELHRRNEELQETLRQLQEAQSQLVQSEKLASIGQLAAGVAHEINNPVGYVSSNLGSMGRYLEELLEALAAYRGAEALLPAEHPEVERLREVLARLDLDYLTEDTRDLIAESKEGVARVKRIVQDLKDFSRANSDEWEWADLHKGLESTLNIVWNELKYKAEVVREYGDLPEIECIPSQLNQVFMNLLVNAAHAIDKHGTITVRSGHEREHIWVEVADTGKGIAPEHLGRLFDPFFTTKPQGQGTGLGLSLAYGIVSAHGGEFEVHSEPGQGTTFRVWLPIEQEGHETAPAR